MIKGIGNDIIEIERVVKACEKEAFLKKVFTAKEIELIKSDSKKAASNFAVKEAVSKVFGTGFSKVRPIDIEVLRQDSGKPYVVLHGRAKELSDSLHIISIFISISNTSEYVCAFAVGEGD